MAVDQESATRGQFRQCLEKLKHDMDQKCFAPPFCLPANVTSQQITDIVCKWLEDNPGNRHYTARGAVFSALGDPFPCLEETDIRDARMQYFDLKK
jgi:hypothetical protein